MYLAYYCPCFHGNFGNSNHRFSFLSLCTGFKNFFSAPPFLLPQTCNKSQYNLPILLLLIFAVWVYSQSFQRERASSTRHEGQVWPSEALKRSCQGSQVIQEVCGEPGKRKLQVCSSFDLFFFFITFFFCDKNWTSPFQLFEAVEHRPYVWP